MRIRTQLILTFLLLAILPLLAIVMYSYVSSQRAVREAVAAEAEVLAQRMDERLADIRSDLDNRFERVGELPFRSLLVPEGSWVGEVSFEDEFASTMGDSAQLVKSVEFVPMVTGVAVPSEAALGALAAELETAEIELEEGDLDDAERSGAESFILNVEEIMLQVEASIAEIDFEELDYEGDVEELKAGARAGVEMVTVIADGISRIVETIEEAGTEPESPADEGLIEEESPAAAPRPPRPHPAGGIPPVHPPSAPKAEELARYHKLVARRQALTAEQQHEYEESARKARMVFGREFRAPVLEGGRRVGELTAQVSGEEVLHRVLGRVERDRGEIPFALDEEGGLYTVAAEDRAVLERLDLPIGAHERVQSSPQELDDWVVVTSQDEGSGLTFGIARPISDNLSEIRTAAARNFGVGLGLIGVALLGILPLTGRMTRNLKAVTEGAERIAAGNLDVEVPVTSRNEVGQLARAFNRMAKDLDQQQQRLVTEERLRHEQQVEQEVLRVEFDRKSGELEEARRFQLSLLPKQLPTHDAFELAVYMRTATEVGGDYYDFRMADDGSLTAVIGDATGHGARAGTMVTVIKSLFSAYPPEVRLPDFLAEASQAIKRMELGRMAMALSLLQLKDGKVVYTAAGMPPVLVHRAEGGRVEEVQVAGMPLGSLEFEYREERFEVTPGDTLLLMSDGFPELPDPNGEPLGYERVRELFAECAQGNPQNVITHLSGAAETWTGGEPPNDDVTFVALKVRAV